MTTQSIALTSLLLAGFVAAQAQPQPATAYRPSREEILQRYREAALLDSTARNTVFKSFVQPNWQADQKSFWYRNNLKDSATEYIYVDAASGKKAPAFDHAQLAAALSKAAGKTIPASRLGINTLVFDSKAKTVSFRLQQQWYKYDAAQQSCVSTTAPDTTAANAQNPRRRSRWERNSRPDSTSPDKQWVWTIKDYNVYIRPATGGKAVQYTTDGSKDKPYDHLFWSPDSKYAIGYKTDPREQKEVYYVLTSQPNTMRGQLRSQRYAQPGDEFTSYEMYTFNVASKKATKVNTEKYDFLGAPYIRWRKDNRYFTYEKADRGHQRFRIIEVDSETGNTRNVIDEQTNTFIYEQRIFTHYLPDTDEIIWSSEKDGWRHLYLVNVATGTIKNAITTGDWVVRDIDSIDEKKREVWFRASGMQAGEDPYNVHFYRISFDGKKLVSLTPAVGNHTINWSPDRKYFTDTYSAPAVAPITTLNRTADGKQVIELEKADISAYLALGIQLPEVFVAKARDGKTDIWGVVCRPRNYDPNKKYPVIENIYAGPQDAFVPKSFMSYGEMQSMAELGFIVVQCDGMGTANRSKAFHDVCWKNLADAGLPDRILWIKALAAKYPYVDVDRVGLYGTSAGGQNSAGALLFHPEFYKAAVSACGCHDNRVDKQWWNEQWMGYPIGKHYEEQSNITNAAKLQGKLLLIVGEADTNVPPESTYRLADALIKSNKMFDFLTVPGMGHSDGGPYGRKKKRDFFVKELLGVDPPDRNIGEIR
ncbi:S9 family peptidase [Paraflavitalea sp. CAU 1676]|uniref:S9 family peptidase n=1 Tax=Paraflavitalea sp. CAU 1676 TaxID=3032598 RepID=UPI0023DC854C|nr:S9 family peptidase [Paraflavitalea sp. CAU 1676]MDF2190474.1 prolyl oligopeptidase family serine peptidase [Paraflavitalea sp. CAU 1676]